MSIKARNCDNYISLYYGYNSSLISIINIMEWSVLRITTGYLEVRPTTRKKDRITMAANSTEGLGPILNRPR